MIVPEAALSPGQGSTGGGALSLFPLVSYSSLPVQVTWVSFRLVAIFPKFRKCGITAQVLGCLDGPFFFSFF